MRPGKVSQAIISRSVLKPFRKQEKVQGLEPLEIQACSVMEAGGEQVVTATASRYGKRASAGRYALAEALGHLKAKGIRAERIGIFLFLPQWMEEEELKILAQKTADAASKCGLRLQTISAEVLPGLEDVLVQVQVQGRQENKEQDRTFLKADLVCIGNAGLEGTFRILSEKEEELKKRFIPAFLQPLKEKEDTLFLEGVEEVLKGEEVFLAHPAGEGGIFAALWDVTAGTNHGMLVDLKKIQLQQETVEICEYFNLNPYQLASAGCMLVAVKDGEHMVRELKNRNLSATVLGVLNNTNDKLIRNGEETRCLDRPAPDEIVKIYKKEN